MRRALDRLLHLLGFNVAVFDSAEAFLAIESPTSGACVLADLHLPGMSGFELCTELAESSHSIPTILMSSRNDLPTKRLMREAKPAATLFKPFDQRMLLRAIRKAQRNR